MLDCWTARHRRSLHPLAAQATVMRGSVVELLAATGRLQVLVHHPRGEKEMHWLNGQPFSRHYRCSIQENKDSPPSLPLPCGEPYDKVAA